MNISIFYVLFQSDLYQVSHRYGIFSWWWTYSCPKHVEKSNKHIKKICAPSWFYLQEYIRMSVRTFSSKIAQQFLKKCICGVHKDLTGEFNFKLHRQ